MSPKTAAVLSGGGARGAYEAGVWHYIREYIPESFGKIKIYCGSSVGAINAAVLAAYAHDDALQGNVLHKLWMGMESTDVYKVDPKIPVLFGLKYLSYVVLNQFRKQEKQAPLFNGVVNVDGLIPFLKRSIPFANIRKNLAEGHVEALSVVATNLLNGKPEIFLHKSPMLEYFGKNFTHIQSIYLKHILASSALPILFPPVYMNNAIYADGSMRMSTPIAPALYLNADKVLIIHTRSREFSSPRLRSRSFKQTGLGIILGKLLNSVFLDKLDGDLAHLEKINQLLKAGEDIYGKDFISSLNDNIKPTKPLKNIETLMIRPSIRLSDVLARSYPFSKPKKFAGIFPSIATNNSEESTELLSYMHFGKKYIEALLELGYEDAKNQREALKAFFKE